MQHGHCARGCCAGMYLRSRVPGFGPHERLCQHSTGQHSTAQPIDLDCRLVEAIPGSLLPQTRLVESHPFAAAETCAETCFRRLLPENMCSSVV